MSPKYLILVEQDSSHNGPFFLGRFMEALHYYSAIFDSLDTMLPRYQHCISTFCFRVPTYGCYHEFCTRCALYLCSTNCMTTVAHGPPGSTACPLCRHDIVSFVKLEATSPIVKDSSRTSLSLSFCTCTTLGSDTLETPFCKTDVHAISCHR
ncbi:hypothetical protein POM88_015460 [Heracleum sosnowskyi]|uniref:RING-type domain-containing protein n=1 Tax=Heracleum sosnowskyi TaxID=360622 RepID=A0AAD8IMY4_9APIA|nr:hypothetical protein POM88_015457 [Heracleum sosnowskyi]KAK1387282.1 hypothetical protein POM88_015460 [Heracleum sosnowskyi]